MIVLVCGASPTQSLEESRKQIRDGIEAILPHAEAAGVKLAIEPLHPMYADDRSAINTMKSISKSHKTLRPVGEGGLSWSASIQQEQHPRPPLRFFGGRHGEVCRWRTVLVSTFQQLEGSF